MAVQSDGKSISFDNGLFSYEGYQYLLAVVLFADNMGESLCIPMSNQQIKTLEVDTSLDKLFSRGFMLYKDRAGEISKLLGLQDATLTISLTAYRPQQNGEAQTTVKNDEQSFSHKFFIDNIVIVDDKRYGETYRIDFTGVEQRGLQNKAEYTTDGQQELFKAVKNVLAFSGTPIDGSFDKLQSGVVLPWYITAGNDTVQTSVNYLLQKQFFFNDQANDKMRFIVYDFIGNKYCLAQPDRPRTGQSERIMLSKNEGVFEGIMNQDGGVRLASVSDVRNSDLRPITGIKQWQYSFSKNGFNTKTKESSEIVNYFRSGQSTSRRIPLKNDIKNYKMREVSLWDDDIDVYGDMLDLFMRQDSILVDTGAIVKRRLMDVATVFVDNSIVLSELDISSKEQSRRTHMYEQLKGGWFVTGIRYVIRDIADGQGVFNQVLQLSRAGRTV